MSLNITKFWIVRFVTIKDRTLCSLNHELEVLKDLTVLIC